MTDLCAVPSLLFGFSTPLPLCWCSESRVGRSTEGSIDVDLAERKQGPESQSIETKNGLDGI